MSRPASHSELAFTCSHPNSEPFLFPSRGRKSLIPFLQDLDSHGGWAPYITGCHLTPTHLVSLPPPAQHKFHGCRGTSLLGCYPRLVGTMLGQGTSPDLATKFREGPWALVFSLIKLQLRYTHILAGPLLAPGLQPAGWTASVLH